MLEVWSVSHLDLFDILFYFPLQCYETLILLPVRFFRRHFPLVGGIMVLAMTFHGIFLRRLLTAIEFTLFTRWTYSKNALRNFHAFWKGCRDRYAFFLDKQVEWNLVQRIFGDKMTQLTSEEDLWSALVDSLSLLADPGVSIKGFERGSVDCLPHKPDVVKYKEMATHFLRHQYLIDTGGRVANHLVFGIVNAEHSTGWRFGYISMLSMEGFVELPSMQALLSPNAAEAGNNKDSSHHHHNNSLLYPESQEQHRLVVPEMYDLESMRWALEAILSSLGELDGLILDLRLNDGGGSHISALHAASYFMPPSTSDAVFYVEERLPGAPSRFTKRHPFYIPSPPVSTYTGPMVILQGEYTTGTAEVLSMAMERRGLDTHRIGCPSFGSLSQVSKFSLPNGWQVEVPYQRVYNVDGQSFEGKGVPVDEAADTIIHDICQKVDPCMKAAVEYLMQMHHHSDDTNS